MKRTKWLICLMLVLVLAITIVGLTACNDDDQNGSDTAGESLVASKTLDWVANGQYSGEIALDAENSTTFRSFTKDDFTLTASGFAAGNSVSISEFTVSAKDENTLAFSFTSPFVDNTNLTYLLLSKAGVTNNNSQVGAFIYINMPQVGVENFTYTGAYVGSSQIVATVELEQDAKYVSLLNTSMFSVASGIGEVVAVNRVNDKKATVTIGNISRNITSDSFTLTVLDDAIDSQFATDVTVYVNYAQPNLTIENVTYSSSTHVITVGNVKLPDGIVGVQNGVSVYDSSVTTLESQSYSKENNSYSLSLKLVEEAIEVYGEELSLEMALVNVSLKIGGETYTKVINPYCVPATILSNTALDTDDDKIEITFEVVGGTFVDGLTISDFTITGADGLQNLSLKSIDSTAAVFSASYTSSIADALTVQIKLGNAKVNTTYGTDDYTAVVFVPAYSDGRVDWDALGDKLTNSAVDAIGGQLGSAVVGFALPYVYDFFEIDTADKDIVAIKNELAELKSGIESLSRDVKNVVSSVKVESNKRELSDHQTNLGNLTIDNNTIMDNTAAVEYLKSANAVNAQNAANNTSVAQYLAAKKAKPYYEEFLAYATSRNVTSSPFGSMLSFYNTCIRVIKNHGKDVFVRSLPSMYIHDIEDPDNTLDAETVYNICKNLKTYTAVSEAAAVEETTKDGFVAAVAASNASNAYIKEVSTLGESIIATSAGTDGGIFKLYFSVIDSIYNFASQTTAAKTAFVSQAYATYLIGVGVAIEYCQLTNNISNLAMLRAQLSLVLETIKSAYAEIKAIETLNAGGHDTILASGQTVSKKLRAHDVSVDSFYYNNMLINDTWGVTVTHYTLETMVQRASDRGRSLAEDLSNAGFSNITPESTSSPTKYVYASSTGTRYEDMEFKASSFFKALGSLVGVHHTTKVFHLTTDIVVQTGKSACATNKNATYYEYYNDIKSAYDRTTTFVTTSYKTVIFFAK